MAENKIILNRVECEEVKVDDNLETTPIVIGRIAKTNASHTLAKINQIWPMEEQMRHLKRIRPSKDPAFELEVLLGSGDPSDYQDLEEIGNLEIVQVPLHPPPNREAFGRWNSLWPVTFHQDMDAKMRAAEEARILQILLDNNRLEDDSYCCVVFDYKSGAVVCKVDLPMSCTEYHLGATHLPISQPLKKEAVHPLQHPVLRAIQAVAAVNRREEYLCNGKIFLCRHEPCLFCAMALVHSRVQAVVFELTDPESGALGSCTNLMSLRRLNHHYSVFKLSQV